MSVLTLTPGPAMGLPFTSSPEDRKSRLPGSHGKWPKTSKIVILNGCRRTNTHDVKKLTTTGGQLYQRKGPEAPISCKYWCKVWFHKVFLAPYTILRTNTLNTRKNILFTNAVRDGVPETSQAEISLTFWWFILQNFSCNLKWKAVRNKSVDQVAVSTAVYAQQMAKGNW